MRGGALAAPFVFLGAAIAVWSSSRPSPILWAASLSLLGTAWLLSGRTSPAPTSLAITVWAYVAWSLTQTGFISSYYNPTGLFDPMFLLAGFSLGRALGRSDAERACALLMSGIAALAVWGVLQLPFGWARAQAAFETPNALASVVNLGLAFTVVLIARGVRRVALDWLAIIFFAGLCATFSRGAAIAFVAALLITFFLGRLEGVQWEQVRRLVAFFFAGALTVCVAVVMRKWLPDLGSPSVLTAGLDSLAARFELYRVAWDAIHAPFCCGIGYLGFRWLLERERALVPSYGEESITYFVHNDYMQALLELGAPALGALVLAVGLPFVLARRPLPAGRDDRRVIAASLAGLATMVVHAIGDFPFHTPICILLFGLLLGHIDRLTTPPGSLATRWHSPVARVTLIVLSAGLMTLLARPVLAAAAVAYGMYQWRSEDGRAAAYGLELARRMDPRDWRFHLYAGQFWFAQAAQTGEPEAAQRAEAAFVAGIAANPFETSTRFGRIATNIRFASLLTMPADARTLRTWADDALALAPLNPAARAQHAHLVGLIETTQ